MVKLPQALPKTVAAIFDRYVRDADDWRRPHLGASVIGRECLRHLWYLFRWASPPVPPARFHGGQIRRLWERGQREEAWLIEELLRIGVEVHSRDPNTKEQWRVSLLPHFGGSADAVGLGFPEAPKTWHLIEFKTSNDKSWQKLASDGVRKAKPEHYDQMQVYMHGLELTRAMYLAVNKDDDQIHAERVYYDKVAAEALLQKASIVIRSSEPLSKIREDPSWFACKFCDHRGICHLEELDRLERNCRTCASSTPLADGTWRCEFHGKLLDVHEQRAGCESHLFIPALLPWRPLEVDEPRRRVIYERKDGVRVTDHARALTVAP